MNYRKSLAWMFIFIIVVNGIIWSIIKAEQRGEIMKVVFLNVGQGDAIFIEAPNGNELLVDGGPPHAVVRELAEVMPFYDRDINMIVVTNPDADHISGFIDVLEHFKVTEALEPGTRSPSATYKELEESIKKHSVRRTVTRRGMKIWVDRARKIYLEVLFPDRDVSRLTTNDGSLIMKLHYGMTSYMLMGDAPQKMEHYMLSLGDDVDADVLKLGHHGSRTSSAMEFVKAVHPRLAVISAGYKNKYGHPHKETMDTLYKLHIPYLTTFEHGRVVTTTDGQTLEIK